MKLRAVLALGAAVLCAVLAMWSLGDGVVQVGRPAPSDAARDPAEPVAGAPCKRREFETSRFSAAVQAQPITAQASEPPVHGTSYLARFLVVDDDQRPVPDATVTIWAAQKLPAPANSYGGRESEPLLAVRTDALGGAQAVLDLECIVAGAERTDCGSSAEAWLRRAVAAEQETKLVLRPARTLHGIVIAETGAPEASTRVTATACGSNEPKVVIAGPDGRFELQVHKDRSYELLGELDGRKTFPESVCVTDRPAETVLTFPGAITVSGLVVDAGGRPVANAEVRGWRECHAGDASDCELVRARTAEDGRFSVPVRAHHRYQFVAGSAPHANSRSTWIETTTARPHAEVRLELPAFAHLTGHVLHGDCTPFPGVSVVARPEQGDSGGQAGVPGQRELFGPTGWSTTAADGSFTLDVHPATTWTVYAKPLRANEVLSVERRGVAAGSRDVDLRISDAELAGCVVHVTVRRTDGERLGLYGVQVVPFEEGRALSDGTFVPASVDEGGFTLPPLPLGRQFAVRVMPKDNEHEVLKNTGPVAPAQTLPFITGRPELTLDILLECWGRLPVRVLAADGSAARRVGVLATRDVHLGYRPSPQPVDVEGTVVLARCAPGAHHLRILAGEKVFEQEVLIAPGINPEIVVRLLPARPR
jgi:hypothetical protein